MTKTNQVYNSHFLLWQESKPDFPDGWLQTGGDMATKWKWVGAPEGPSSIRPNSAPEEYIRGFSTPVGVTGIRVEVRKFRIPSKFGFRLRANSKL